MCEVTTIALVVGAVMAAGAIYQDIETNKANRRYEKALQKQADQRSEEVRDQASVEMNERARAVRRARAAARASASEAGINLDSGSFLAQLQSFDAQQDLDAGIITKNQSNRLKAGNVEHGVALSRISYKSGLGIALDGATAGVQGYYGAGGNSYTGSKPGQG